MEAVREQGWRPGWWEEAFPRTRNASEIAGHPRGNPAMLVVVAYDIANPKRLRLAAECCKDYGMRVQYSVFECHLEAAQFDALWARLTEIADPENDRIVAYPIHGGHRSRIQTFGRMVCADVVVSYQF